MNIGFNLSFYRNEVGQFHCTESATISYVLFSSKLNKPLISGKNNNIVTHTSVDLLVRPETLYSPTLLSLVK